MADLATDLMDTDELVELAERMRDLGAASFTVGGFSVTFRADAGRAAPVEVAAPQAGERPAPKRPADPRQAAVQAFGEISFPGSKVT